MSNTLTTWDRITSALGLSIADRKLFREQFVYRRAECLRQRIEPTR